jgi:hypothetical protein
MTCATSVWQRDAMAIFRPWSEVRRAFSADQIAAIREPLLESPLVGKSTLGGSFRASRGFALTFREEGRAKLSPRFAPVVPFIDAAVARVKRWRLRKPNAWYLNLLLVSPGGSVGRHVDGTLRGPSGESDATPVVVSVLYLSSLGGPLVLSRGTRELHRITPREGAMVHFKGELDHAVEATDGEGLRISLVLEQYHFGPAALARLPELKVDSRAGFAAYLKTY